MYARTYPYCLPLYCQSHPEDNSLYTSALHYPIVPGKKIWEHAVILPKGPLKLSYFNTGDYPFKIFVDALGIVLTAEPHTNAVIPLGSPSTNGITLTPLRINCLARDYSVRLCENCSGFINILLDRSARRHHREQRTLPMD